MYVCLKAVFLLAELSLAHIFVILITSYHY